MPQTLFISHSTKNDAQIERLALLLSGKFPRMTIFLMLTQMSGAMSPIVLRPDLVFAQFPYQFTLVGQYIVKDIILVSAALVIAATVRGGKLVARG